MDKQPGSYLIVNPDRCTACKTCELACATAHTQSGSLIGAVMGNEILFPRNRVVEIAEVKLPTQCRQCEDAPCVKVCPTGATYHAEDFTAVNLDLCIACKLCMMVCPFGAIQISTQHVGIRDKRVAVKCDICVDRPGGPACVESCPTKAITIAHPDEVMENAKHASTERFLAAVKAQANLEKQS